MTLESNELTEAHRLIQVRLGARTATLALGVWDLLDLTNIDGSVARWLRAIERIVTADRAESAEVSGRYLATHREMLTGQRGPIVGPAVFQPEALRRSLLITGPYRLKRNLSRGIPAETAINSARADSAGEALRHTLSGSRTTILAAANTDDAILGLQRVTAASPCHFCAMLASRGPVYLTEESASFKPHSRCGCQPEPVYETSAPFTAQADRYQEVWQQAKADAAGEKGLSVEVAFRRRFEGRVQS